MFMQIYCNTINETKKLCNGMFLRCVCNIFVEHVTTRNCNVHAERFMSGESNLNCNI